MAAGITAIQQLLNNWPTIEEYVNKFGEFLNGPVAMAVDFFREYTPKAIALFKWIYDKTGLTGVIIAGVALMNPITTLIALFKTARASITGAMALFRGGAFLAGFLGPIGWAALIGAGLVTAAVVANRIEDEDELLAANEEATANFDATGEFGDVPQPEQTTTVEETITPTDVAPDVAPRVEETPAPIDVAPRSNEISIPEDVRSEYQTLQNRNDELFFNPDQSLRTLSPAEQTELNNNQSRIEQLQNTFPGLMRGSLDLNFPGASEEVSENLVTSERQTNPLLQQIAFNTETTPEKQRTQAEAFVATLSERMNMYIESGVIQNTFGTSVDTTPLSIMTA